MHIRRPLHRPEPLSRLGRLRRWLVEPQPGGPTAADRARIAAILRIAPPH